MTAALEAKDRNGGSQSQGQLSNQDHLFEHNFFEIIVHILKFQFLSIKGLEIFHFISF